MSKKEECYALFDSIQVGQTQWVTSSEVTMIRVYLSRYMQENNCTYISRYFADRKQLMIQRVE
jgi:hypothetical protein